METMDNKPDLQIVNVSIGYVIEVNCNGGGRRCVLPDGRIEAIAA